MDGVACYRFGPAKHKRKVHQIPRRAHQRRQPQIRPDPSAGNPIARPEAQHFEHEVAVAVANQNLNGSGASGPDNTINASTTNSITNILHGRTKRNRGKSG